MPPFTEEHVRKAFKVLEREGIPEGFGPSTKWDIVDDATQKPFPPKAVLFLAKRSAGDTSRSGGGGDRGTNNALRERGFSVVLKARLEHSQEAEDIETILESGADATTKQRLVNARLGQGGFREALLEVWGGRCAVTGCDIEPVLRASHIKPWRASTDAERLDPHNGVLLAASIDALFDKCLITVTEDGGLRAAASLGEKPLEKLGLQRGHRIALGLKSQTYMNWHREEFERVSVGRFLEF